MIATSWLAPGSWEKTQEEAIREAIGAGPDWEEYLRLVDRHRTPALSWAALSRVPGVVVPEPARQELQKRNYACRMENVKHCLLLAEVLKAFNRAGIPAMPFKGQILSFELYGDVGLRHARDLDLAVAREDLSKAQACLENMGWHLDGSTWFPLTPRQRESFLRHEHSLDFVHSHSGGMLELHWRNQWETPEVTSARWSRSIATVWQGCSILAMNRSDQVLYLCSHGGDHLWFRVKWLGDLARAHAAGQVDWETALGEAQRTGLEAALLVGLGLLNRVYGLPIPDLSGEPWIDLPSVLIEIPLHALQAPEEPAALAFLPKFRRRLRISRYERLVQPRKSWRDSLSQFLYCREDFRDIRLPDSLFWAYVPLRPILRVWRLVRQRGLGARESKA
jgi:hypothetical protein